MSEPSYVSGTSDKPLIGRTIGVEFDRVCAEHPQTLALISRHQQVRWTYAELKARVDALAAGLLALGLARGDRVGIWAPNCAEWAITQFATAKAGMILVTVNPAYRPAEAEYALNKVGCKALVTAVRHKTSDYVAMLRELAPELAGATPGKLAAARLPHLKLIVTIGEDQHPGCLPFPRALEAGRPQDHEALRTLASELQFDDPINIQFTSGTTGAPKGATLSHHNILNNGYFCGQIMRFTPGERVCIPVPLYHCAGMVIGNLACLTHAATMVYPSEGFDPGAAMEAVQAERCSVLYSVPTMFIAMLAHPEFDRFDLSTLRTGIIGGAPCPVEVMRQIIERMHMPEVSIVYGMTETSPVSFQTSPDDPLERRVSTVGRVHPHVEVKIVDAEGRVTPRGVQGELCTRGYSVMLGYWEDVGRTAEALDSAGWMHTGDLGVLDEAGYCNITGRAKDMVIRGGENIYPREIEEFLYRHPAVQDVQVIGVPDPKFGEELAAWIIVKAGESLAEAEVRGFCQGQIAHYKIPRYVRFVDGFPTTISGKVQKFAMREAMIAELDLVLEKTA